MSRNVTPDYRNISGAEDLVARGIVSRESSHALQVYVDLLLHWQTRINLIGPATVSNIWTRHVADGLQLQAYLPKDARTLIDLGSGAGIPGLVLALAWLGDEDRFVHLVEANAKKAAFLREAIRETGARAQVIPDKIESIDSAALRPTPDVVVSRALAPLPALLDYASKFLENGAVALFHKGQDVDSELTASGKCWTIRATTQPSLIDSAGCILKVNEAHRDGSA